MMSFFNLQYYLYLHFNKDLKNFWSRGYHVSLFGRFGFIILMINNNHISNRIADTQNAHKWTGAPYCTNIYINVKVLLCLGIIKGKTRHITCVHTTFLYHFIDPSSQLQQPLQIEWGLPSFRDSHSSRTVYLLYTSRSCSCGINICTFYLHYFIISTI